MEEDFKPDNITPSDLCYAVLESIYGRWIEWQEIAGRQQGEFKQVLDRIFANGDSGDKFEADCRQWVESDSPKWNETELIQCEKHYGKINPPGLVQMALISCAYACQGIKAEEAKDNLHAWRYAASAAYWQGVVDGTWGHQKSGENPAVIFAKKGAAASHKKHHALKKMVLKHYLANPNKYHSKDAAAEAMAGKTVDASFRTVRNYLKGV